MAVLGFTFLGASGVAIIAAGGTALYCHSEPSLTSGKLCFIINFIGGTGGQNFYWGGGTAPPGPPLNRPWLCLIVRRTDSRLLTTGEARAYLGGAGACPQWRNGHK